jgi:hypothetical protein
VIYSRKVPTYVGSWTIHTVEAFADARAKIGSWIDFGANDKLVVQCPATSPREEGILLSKLES